MPSAPMQYAFIAGREIGWRDKFMVKARRYSMDAKPDLVKLSVEAARRNNHDAIRYKLKGQQLHEEYAARAEKARP